MGLYQLQKTALVIIDPFNDFLSEGGKLFPATKETVEGNNVVSNIKKLLTAAREKKIQVIYAPHRHTQKEIT